MQRNGVRMPSKILQELEGALQLAQEEHFLPLVVVAHIIRATILLTTLDYQSGESELAKAEAICQTEGYQHLLPDIARVQETLQLVGDAQRQQQADVHKIQIESAFLKMTEEYFSTAQGIVSEHLDYLE